MCLKARTRYADHDGVLLLLFASLCAVHENSGAKFTGLRKGELTTGPRPRRSTDETGKPATAITAPLGATPALKGEQKTGLERGPDM